ncbi:MAG: N-formylglutamate amidohydrolase [Polyangiales bacterium]
MVEIPHAGTVIPSELRDGLSVAPEDVLRDADTFVDALWTDAPAAGAVSLVARISRYVVDLNRAEDDVDARAVEGARVTPAQPRGVIWRQSGAGRCVLPSALSREAYRGRLERYYAPYHAALATELRALHARHGRVILIAAHSMPSAPRLGGPGARRAAIVPGTRGRTTADGALIDAVDAHFRAAGLSVRHDDPYRGGATTARWGRPAQGFHAIQIEVNRGLYLDETSLRLKADGVAWLRGLCASLIPRLVSALDGR